MTTSKFILPILLFVLTLAAGFWVTKSGKPYNTGIFTVHKLLALAAVIMIAIPIARLLKTGQIQSLIIILVVLAALCVLALFATGAVMSIQKTGNTLWLMIHRVAPVVLAGSTLGMILLLVKH